MGESDRITRTICALAILLALSGALVAWMLTTGGGPIAFDLEARSQVDAHATTTVSQISLYLTELGSGVVLYPLLIALAMWRRTWRTALLPAFLAVGQLAEIVLLSVLPRTSPELPLFVGVSSGRTTTAMLGWGLVAIALGASTRRALAVGLTVGALVAATRVVLNLHWMSDVWLALLVGALLLIVARSLLDRIPPTAITARALRSWFHSRWAWAMPAIASVGVVMPMLLDRDRTLMGDLAVYVGSAHVIDAGGDLYQFQTTDGLPFTYPPFAALLAEPLARMPLPLVQGAWVLATMVALVAVAAVAMKPIVARIGLPLTVTLLLASTPVRSHFRFGQVGLFLVLLVSADLLQRHRRHGWGVGLASAIKITPTIYLLWWGAVGQWSRWRAAFAWAAGATVAGVVLLWPSSPTWITGALWDSSRFGLNDIPGNQSVRGMLLRAFSDDTTAERVWVVCAVVLLVVGVIGARRLELAGHRLGAVGTLAATSVAVSPISWQHHLVWLVLPIAALVGAGRARIAIGWAVLLIAPVTTWGVLLHESLEPSIIGATVINTCGLTAVAACLLLPTVLLRDSADRGLVDGGSIGRTWQDQERTEQEADSAQERSTVRPR